jgi:hypothetical protein
MNPAPSIKRFLRSPKVILGEIAAFAVAGGFGASLPDSRVFQSPGFAALTLLTASSLAIVVVGQFRRLRSQWNQSPSAAVFQSAPFRREFERPATPAQPRQSIWSERRLGLAGSFVFHCGLLLIIIAGAARALFATAAVVDLVEGETLAPTAAAWSAQWPGLFARPFRLAEPITLESVSGSRYPGGDLRALRARFSAGEIAVNHQLRSGSGRLYLAQEFGPTALLEWNSGRREAALLAHNGQGNFEGISRGPDALRAHVSATAERPASIEVRVMRGAGLLLAGTMRVGETVALPGGASLTLRGTPMWVRVHGSRDSALGLAYLGFALVMAGATMIFTLVKLDFCVTVTPLGERERVFIALKPQRFAPLFQERFEKLVHEQSGLAQPCGSRGDEALTERPGGGKAEGNNKSAPSRVVACARPALARTACWLLLGVCVAFTGGCNRVSPTQARQLVERYNQVVSEAYRRGDVRLIDPVVGPNEGKKLTGLIGVRLDMGITLDSKILSLDIAGVEQSRNELRVRTRERWSYRDLKIGTGEQVGEASRDAYEMLYVFTNLNRTWLVDEIKFASPPRVGRTNMPWVADHATLHGFGKPEVRP